MYIRVKQALNWIKRNKDLLQKDVAKEMGMNEASFTRALARIRDKNDEYFVMKFQSVFNFFSLDYLLTGEGELLLSSDKKTVPDTQGMVSEDNPPAPLPLWADTLIGIMSKQIAENEALHSELCKSINDVNELKKQLSELLCQLKK